MVLVGWRLSYERWAALRGTEPHPNGTVHITVGTGGGPLWRSYDVRGSFIDEPRQGSVVRIGNKHGHLSLKIMSNGTLLAQFHEMTVGKVSSLRMQPNRHHVELKGATVWRFFCLRRCLMSGA